MAILSKLSLLLLPAQELALLLEQSGHEGLELGEERLIFVKASHGAHLFGQLRRATSEASSKGGGV